MMGLRTLVESVSDTLHDLEGYEDTVVEYGRKALTKQTNQGSGRANRVVFCPAESPGSLDAPRNPGQPLGPEQVEDLPTLGRPLYTWNEPIEVHCWAWDATAPADELAQDDAARLLAMATMAAIHESPSGGHGAHKMSAPRFTKRPVELKFGSEVVFILTIGNRVGETPAPSVLVSATTTPKTVFPDSTSEDPSFDVPLPPPPPDPPPPDP